jgi:branched-chain amino acid transport system ATP-binding protein
MGQILELVDIHTYYGESHVLWGVSLKLEQGSVVAILGRNGMGKTTIIHSIIGFAPPRQGKVLLKEKDVTNLQPNRIARMGVALVPQGRRIFSSLSVKENITIGARGSEQTDAWTLDKIYAMFPRLKERSHHKGNLLSGGEQQMLTISRALMTNPDLLLMDEPSEGLAPLIVKELGNTIKDLNQRGLSILLVEQNINLALAVADYVYIVQKGKIVHECTPVELEKDEKIKEMYIGVSR